MTARGQDDIVDAADLEDEYEIIAELGRGGSAIVYRARDRRLQRDVAIKVVRARGLHGDEEQVARLAREARTVAQVDHPLIVKVYAVRPLVDGLALIMQWIPGRTLKQRIIEEGPLPIADAEAVLANVATALAVAHARGIVHRDVKPENIFLDAQSGTAMLSDFGIAQSHELDARLTQTGVAIGTPTYMAPEQIDGEGATARSDVYSLGLVGWEMLTGRQPWSGASLYAILYHQKHDALPSIDSLRPDVPERLQYIVERALQKRPGARWAGADGMLAQLRGSVLPADWHAWQQMHARRRRQGALAATKSAAPHKPHATPPHGETVRFRRDPVAASALAAAAPAASTIGATGPDSTLASGAAADAVADAAADAAAGAAADAGVHDDVPDWGVDDTTAAPRTRRVIIAAAALIITAVAVMGAIGVLTRWRELRAPSEVRVAARTDSSARISVPIVSAPSDAVAPARPDSAVIDSADVDGGDDADTVTTPPPARPPAPPRSDATIRPRRGAAAVDSAAARIAVGAPSRVGVRSGTATTGTVATGTIARGTITNGTIATPSSAGVALASGETVRAVVDPAIVAAGGHHTCALAGERIRCWGDNDNGQLGTGDGAGLLFGAPVSTSVGFVAVTSGVGHSCGLARDGTAYCWGGDDAGQLGDATTISRSAPVRVATSLTFRQLRAGRAHTCGLTDAGQVACWGDNRQGQLGDGTTLGRATPVLLPTSTRWISVAVGWGHSCAVARDGAAFCWGDNRDGQLGDGTTTPRPAATAVATELRFRTIAAGAAHTCGVSLAGDLWCWGRNTAGQLGIGERGTRVVRPTRVSVDGDVRAIALGTVHSCARTSVGAVWCWGGNPYGQLGDGTTTDRLLPTRVAGGWSFIAIDASSAHTCGATNTRDVLCWGYNADGQLGDSAASPGASRARPTRVPLSSRLP